RVRVGFVQLARSVVPACLRADEKDSAAPRSLPRGYVRSVHVHFSCAVAGGDVHFGQPSVPCNNSDTIWNSKAAVQLPNGCRIHAITSAFIRDRLLRAFM